MAYLFKLNIKGWISAGTSRELFSANLSRFLAQIATRLEDQNYFFESSTASDIGRAFEELSHDAPAEEFAGVWNDLVDWGQITIVTVSGSERALCLIPHLPNQMAC